MTFQQTKIYIFPLVTLLGLLNAACSYTTDFFVVNNSTHPIDVIYRVNLTRHLTIEDTPAKIPKSQLGNVKGTGITKLSSEQYRYDQANDTISVRLMPDEAVWVMKVLGYSGNEGASEGFKIESINVKGVEGDVLYTGPQVRRCFAKVSSTLYTCDYQ